MIQFNQTTLAIAVAVGSLASANAATVSVGNPLIPTGVGAGESFQLVFLTKTTTAWMTNPALASSWDSFVNTNADNSSLAGIGDLTWTAMVSTPTVDAKDNGPISTAVYNMNDEQVATGSADMWDGSIAAFLYYDESGAAIANVKEVWTGSNSDGTKAGNPLGDTDSIGQMGDARQTDGYWIRQATWHSKVSTTQGRVYGVSEVITVAVPEPSSTALLGLAGFALILRRRK